MSDVMYEVLSAWSDVVFFTGTRDECYEYVSGFTGIYAPDQFRIRKVEGGELP